MKIRKLVLIVTSLLFSVFFFGQKKTLTTIFTKDKITIDGKFDEPIWKEAPVANDFIMQVPDNGKPEDPERKTEVKIVYDNEAIYVAATMYDNEPKKIMKEISQRDESGAATDFIGVLLNGFNDSQQEYRFFVTAAGVQLDCVYTNSSGEDFSLNLIWDSKQRITDFGWVVEMRIPYAALRFSKEKIQTWGVNFYRDIHRFRRGYSWNLIDAKIESEATQEGVLTGIENIKTPTRLFLIPYTSQYFNGSEGLKTKGDFKGGLDIKYGINDAFTLDAILIPDFGQTAFDRVELNLGPFEQQFNENRPFFTEGTELFSKGGLFYSRRIGGYPTGYPNLSNDEIITKFPTKVSLINALKISGRTKGGLGIGVLNAVTKNTYADIKNTVTGEERQEVIEPLANYNIFVLDQRFHKNSSISVVNTNVTRNGDFQDANVSALVFDLNTKKNTYNLNGSVKYSYVNSYQDLENKKGYKSDIYFADNSGKWRYSIGGEYYSKDYEINDLGINYQTHYHNIYGNVSYRILNPTKTFNSFSVNLNPYAEIDNRTGRLQTNQLNLNFNSTTKKNDYIGFGINGKPLDSYDFYEPRTDFEQKFVTIPKTIGSYLYISTNYNRKFAIDLSPSFTFLNEKGRVNYNLFVNPIYRFSDKFSMNYGFRFNRQNKNTGFIANDANGDIVFARRDRITYTNTLNGKYSLNNKMNINLTIRHYWSYAVNHDILTLEDSGELIPNSTYITNKNSNFNTWNMDLSYSWWFAPGSLISILYRNNSAVFQREFDKDIGANFRNSINHENLAHSFSISVRYFIDYNSLKNHK